MGVPAPMHHGRCGYSTGLQRPRACPCPRLRRRFEERLSLQTKPWHVKPAPLHDRWHVQRSGATCHMPCHARRRILASRAGDRRRNGNQSFGQKSAPRAGGRLLLPASRPMEGYSTVLTGAKAPGQTRTCALAGSTARFATKSDFFPNDDLGRGCAVCVRLRVRTSRDRLADPKTPGASAQG
jgi:hypothetical protein